MPKQARLSGIKSYYCYTIQEAADLVGVCPRTIRNWTHDGLHVLDMSHPPFIRGDDLREYIKAQRLSRKVKTALCEFYCLRCRNSRIPAGAMADCKIKDDKAMLTAICNVCEALMCKPVSLMRLPEVHAKLDLTIKRDESTL